MIQDIFPHRFSNEFENKALTEKGKICHVYQNEIFLLEEKDSHFLPEIQNATEGFLFKLDEEPHFLKEHNESEKALLQENFPNGKWYNRKALRDLAPKHIAFVSALALQLANWYRMNRYCGQCQTAMQKDSKERMLFCPNCKQQVFPKISPAVIVGIHHQDKILLTKYRNGPTTNYALVAGFCEIGETLEETLQREVLEEVGLKVKNLRYYKSQPWPFTDTLLAGFFCELDGSEKITLEENELALAEWFPRNEIPVKENFTSLTNEMICFFKEHPEFFENHF